MGRSVSLAAYMLLSRYGEGWFARKLGSNTERRGIASVARPAGSLIWINVISVSSADAVLALCQRLLDQNPFLNCLITTQTEEAAEALRGQMPARIIHHNTPVDAALYVATFLDHWRPDLCVWTEAAFRPAFVVQAKRRNIPTVYIDAIMSAKSFRRYRLLQIG